VPPDRDRSPRCRSYMRLCQRRPIRGFCPEVCPASPGRAGRHHYAAKESESQLLEEDLSQDGARSASRTRGGGETPLRGTYKPANERSRTNRDPFGTLPRAPVLSPSRGSSAHAGRWDGLSGIRNHFLRSALRRRARWCRRESFFAVIGQLQALTPFKNRSGQLRPREHRRAGLVVAT
jgi:hypothetical protein